MQCNGDRVNVRVDVGGRLVGEEEGASLLRQPPWAAGITGRQHGLALPHKDRPSLIRHIMSVSPHSLPPSATPSLVLCCPSHNTTTAHAANGACFNSHLPSKVPQGNDTRHMKHSDAPGTLPATRLQPTTAICLYGWIQPSGYMLPSCVPQPGQAGRKQRFSKRTPHLSCTKAACPI
jgi:hypothetical protein